MDKTYNPSAIEQSIYSTWEANGCFKPVDDRSKDHFSIMIPPPNVTGSLHMGHAFQDTLMDILVRFERMQQKRTLWQVGTDHAGIATQMVVERQLAAAGTTRHDLGRKAFIDKIWQWKAESGGNITQQLRRLGASVDWSRECFTMDPKLSEAVTEVFVELFNQGIIYRGKRLVNWDPKFRTALSDIEVISEEEPGHLWHFRYPLVNSTADEPDYLVVATTRPETMFGDAAVAIHPEDERYKNLVGREIQLPLCQRTIPIIADDYVDPEFGTGCVKITPAHDFNDNAIGQRHNLPLIEIMTKDATMNDNVPQAFRGLTREEARKKTVAAFDNEGLLEAIQPHNLKVPRGDRSQVIIEPLLTDQWFVATETLAGPAIAAVENGDIEFVPKNWENTYFAWMRNLQDWCISRQLWWGHRIPAWYAEDGTYYVGKDERDVRARHNLGDQKLTQDEDVLDTWFSSALWTFAPLGWPAATQDLEDFHPTNTLVTGFDIIFFWVARMIMMTLKFRQEVPFKTIYIHGLIRDSEGQKMSKSKGNVLDPIDLIDGIALEPLVAKRTYGLMNPKDAKRIEKSTRKEFAQGIEGYGTDALRFTFASLASTGRDIRFDLGRIDGYRNFCNKLWNAARFVHMTCLKNEDQSLPTNHQELLNNKTNLADQWILSRLQATIAKSHRALATYRFDLLAQALYHFTWNEYCDWYLELAKVTLYNKHQDQLSAAELSIQQMQTRHTSVYVLEQILLLLHPIMPFITESIWQSLSAPLARLESTIMVCNYPQVNEALNAPQADQGIEWAQNIITAIRNIRGEMNIAPSKKFGLLLQGGTLADQQAAQTTQALLKSLAQLESIEWLEPTADLPPAAVHRVGELQVIVPLAGLIDVAEEMKRLEKLLEKSEKELQRCQAQMANERFMQNAPADVVSKVKEQYNEAEQGVLHCKNQMQQLNSI